MYVYNQEHWMMPYCFRSNMFIFIEYFLHLFIDWYPLSEMHWGFVKHCVRVIVQAANICNENTACN